MTKACNTNSSEQPPSNKRRKHDGPSTGSTTGNSTKTKKAGIKQEGSFTHRTQPKSKLSLLPSLNLDILLEIFSHLSPIDLLHLARTTKDLRSLLMRKNTTTIWKLAFKQVPEGMPECPQDMSYPAWTHLAFEPICHNCYTSNVRNISWVLRTRLCTRCAKSCLEYVGKFDAKKETDKAILDCVPFDEDYCGRVECCLVSDRRRFVKEFDSHKEDRKKFVEQKIAEVEARTDHALLCKLWSESLANERANELQQIRDERRTAIWEKLSEMGYLKELEFLKDEEAAEVEHPEYVPFYKHPFVRQPRALTNKSWDSAKDDLKVYMEIVRAYIKTKERQKLVWKRRELAALAWHEYRNDRCEPGAFLPNQIDIWLWDPVKTIIEQPSEVQVDQVSFEEVFRGLPHFIKTWQEDKMRQIKRCAAGNSQYEAFWPSKSELEQATCVLSCSNRYYHHVLGRCEDFHETCLMWFPEFIFHTCNSLKRKGHGGGKDDEEIVDLDSRESLTLTLEAWHFRRRQWSTKWLSVDDKASRTVSNILTACGMSPYTKVQEIDQEDPRLVCLKCTYGAKCDGERYCNVMTWRTAVLHNLKKHFGDGQTTFQRISSLDVEEAKRLEEAEPARRRSANPNFPQQPEHKPWRCTKCRDSSMEPGACTLPRLQRHYMRRHGHAKDAELVEDTHYYRAHDQPPPQPLQVRMKPRDPAAAADVQTKST
ncbi:hypothetical protein F5878DRAFT_625885 [Lentinula raphanica]|uniref:F-box domain-containing protein n=1 Tax=Lentinula raphanica TaxID=153919 RepID=A0AA38UC47_9AGAR|nr:hypothetical protein F5878DRAFT_625885 [Lentinula raphanica]